MKKYKVTTILDANSAKQMSVRFQTDEIFALRIMAAHSGIPTSALIREITLKAINEEREKLNIDFDPSPVEVIEKKCK